MDNYKEPNPFDEQDETFGDEVNMDKYIHAADSDEDEQPHTGDGIHGPVCQGCGHEFGPADENYESCDKCCAVLCSNCAIPAGTHNGGEIALCKGCKEETEADKDDS